MTRLDRIKALQSTVKEYVDNERKRIDSEVSILEDILKGRTGGKGIQKINIDSVAAVANSDLATYLKGG